MGSGSAEAPLVTPVLELPAAERRGQPVSVGRNWDIQTVQPQGRLQWLLGAQGKVMAVGQEVKVRTV